jgi:adenine phosphoribosyltransferase
MDLKAKLRHVMDFPREGIDFVDITTVLKDPEAFRQCIDSMSEKLKVFDNYDLIMGPESRGFMFGAPLAYINNKGFIPVRKKGKLPWKTVSVEYELEYGKDVLQIHEDSVAPGQRVVIVDDLLATGGTTDSNIKLVEKLGGEVAGILYFIELEFLKGRDRLKGYEIESILQI